MAGKQKRNSSSENLEKDVSKGNASWSRKKAYVSDAKAFDKKRGKLNNE